MNPEAPWPHLDILARATEAAGKTLVERLAVYPAYVHEMARWIDPGLRTAVLHRVDSDGFARTDGWSPGMTDAPPAADLARVIPQPKASSDSRRYSPSPGRAKRSRQTRSCSFSARARRGFSPQYAPAVPLRETMNVDTVSLRSQPPTSLHHICRYPCQFCAFSKGRIGEPERKP